MKLRVELLLVASTSLLLTVVSAQTTKQGASKGKVNKPRTETANKPRSETMKICQGVPIPPGYVVVAYMTSSTCPHGLYILKKQDPYSDSLTISKRVPGQPGEAASKATQPESSPAPGQPKGTTQPTSLGGTYAPPTVANEVAGPGTRPRRAAPQLRNDYPSLSDTRTATNNAPPTLIGMTPKGSPVNSSPNAGADSTETGSSGPEEVGEGEVLRIDTTLVAVPVSVLDRRGRFIPDLQREDFEIFENGVKQSLAFFEPADKPFTVALLLDTSPSTKFHIWQIKEAAISFAKQLRPQDRVLVVSFNDQVLLLTEVTNDMNTISSVIVQNANMGSATRLYDALDLVIKQRLDKIRGRKAIVLFSDGVDTASYLATYESTMREVEELDALIYPIQYDTTDYLRAMQGANSVTVVTSQSNWPLSGTTTTQRIIQGAPANTNGGAPLPGTTQADYDRADQYLHELADKTAGRLYKANDSTQLAQAFSRIAEELRRQYSLGYYPQTSAVESGERRQIKVRVNRPNLAVRARDSYMKSVPPGPAK